MKPRIRIALLLNVCLCAAVLRAAEPPNLADAKSRITQYKRSGAYDRDVAAAVRKAQEFVGHRAPMVRRPALILDIDETALSNWPQIQANDYGRFTGGPCDLLPAGPCGQIAWQSRAQDEAIAPTLVLFNAAKAKGVAIFFITGRRENLRTPTEANLHKAGYDGWTGLILRPLDSTGPSVVDYKVSERAKIAAEGFTIIANVGDQPSDLAGGYSERTFLVPNPFYRIP
jgi:predicted secreted acid phosphatase